MNALENPVCDRPVLALRDARAVIRLVGETALLPGDHTAKKRHLMDGLCELVDADFWAWALGAKLSPGQLPVYVGFISGKFSEPELAEFIAIQTHADMIRWTEPYAVRLEQTNSHVTGNVQEMFSWTEFQESEGGKWWARAGFEPRCISYRPIPGGGYSAVGLYRKTGRPLFTKREQLLIHIVLTEVPWLHQMGWPDDRAAKIPALPLRCWLVHELLLQGFTRQKIAAHLAISLHTANDYVKSIYRHLGVHSQTELVARFRQGAKQA